MGVKIRNGQVISRPNRLKPEEKASKRIVVADDEKLARMPVVATLKNDGYEIIHEAKDLEELDNIVEMSNPDLVLLDLDWGKGPRQGLDAMERY